MWKLGEMELKLAKTESLNLAQATEIAKLKAALAVAEDKWYNTGFADAENSYHLPITAPWVWRGVGGCSTTDRVPDDLPLRNPKQIPYPEPPPPPIQNPTDTEEEGDTSSMRVLVEAINSHVELVDLEITSNPDALPRNAPSSNPNPATQPVRDVQVEHTTDTAPGQLDDPAF